MYIQNEIQLTLVVLYIFYVASVFSGSILRRASEVVHKFIEREESVECDRLKETCVWRASHSESEG